MASADSPPSAYPATISLVETAPPVLDYREFALPPGCEITDHTGAIAAYSLNTLKPYPTSVLGLLDLKTGTRRVVVARPVNSDLGYFAFTPRLSDSWLVWEEVSPNEAIEPSKATWRLYAAPVDAKRLSLGRPTLVDEGLTDYKPRPHYAVVGSSVFWTVNKIQSPRQEYVERSGSVNCLDLSTGERRTVLRTPRSFPTLCASGGRVVVTEPVADARPGEAGYRVRAHVLGPSGQASAPASDLLNDAPIAHFVQSSGTTLAWAMFSEAGAEWPDLYVRSGSGDILMTGKDSIDPVFCGRYVAFESVEASFTTGGMLRRARGIWLADPEQRTRSRLLMTTDDGWWQTCASGTSGDTLLVWNDLGPWLQDQSTAKTLVRVYANFK